MTDLVSAAKPAQGSSAVLETVKVALAVPLSREFDYKPSGAISTYLVGCRVKVPFGRTHKVGVVVGVGPSSVAMSKLKTIIELLDTEPVLPKDIFELIQWASAYYHHPFGEALATALPTFLRRGNDVKVERPCGYAITEAGLALVQVKRAPAQTQLLNFIRESTGAVSAAECRLFDSRWSSLMKSLLQKELVQKIHEHYELKDADQSLVLNEEQQLASDRVHKHLDTYYCALLDGVTGSGKTEVYLDIARSVIKSGRQVLVLLPEIGLTPQLVARFRNSLGCQVDLLHSGLNDTERLLAWRAASQGQAQVVIGTRSAVFTPMPKLGFIVVDEEHDGSLKQQDGFRYQARDLAMVRAKKAGIPIVLGSATPSLELLHNAEKGVIETLYLRKRAVGAKLPKVLLLDSRGSAVENGLSVRFVAMMHEVLKRNEQVMVFINRRGYAPVLMCEQCATIVDCANCDAHMTVHSVSNRLRCHHCGDERRVPPVCGSCESPQLINVGMGTERIDEYLSAKFPEHKVLRIDRDSTRRKGELQRHLAMAASGEAHILVGTQMLAKGHHFPNVTLVGIVDADKGLFGADFRAVEQMGQLILQVAGRAGRAEKPGTVFVQSRQPDHPLLTLLLSEGYAAFAAQLLRERSLASWPPYVHIALVRSDSEERDLARKFLSEVRDLIVPTMGADTEVTLLGPAHAPMERLARRYRAQLLILSSVRNPLHKILAWLRPTLESHRKSSKVRWSIDVDPYDML